MGDALKSLYVGLCNICAKKDEKVLTAFLCFEMWDAGQWMEGEKASCFEYSSKFSLSEHICT